MQAQENADHHQHNPAQTALIHEVDGGIDLENEVGGEDERRGDKQNLRHQERQSADWYKHLEQADHRRAGLANKGER